MPVHGNLPASECRTSALSNATGGQRGTKMSGSLLAKPFCVDCGAPMDEVQAVVVLASLRGHAIFECEWCGHITLIADPAARPERADWLDAFTASGARGISCALSTPDTKVA